MSGWSNKTFQLIAEIEKEHKQESYDKLIIEKQDRFFEITDIIQAIKGYDSQIKKDGNKYFKHMLKLYKRIPWKSDDYFYVFLYTDLLKKLDESPDMLHKYMSICVIVPQICKAIKYYCGEIE